MGPVSKFQQNWKLEVMVFMEEGKLRGMREPAINSTHMGHRVQELNLGHNGGRRAPCANHVFLMSNSDFTPLMSKVVSCISCTSILEANSMQNKCGLYIHKHGSLYYVLSHRYRDLRTDITVNKSRTTFITSEILLFA